MRYGTAVGETLAMNQALANNQTATRELNSRLGNLELLRVVLAAKGNYEPWAVELAREELERRGVHEGSYEGAIKSAREERRVVNRRRYQHHANTPLSRLAMWFFFFDLGPFAFLGIVFLNQKGRYRAARQAIGSSLCGFPFKYLGLALIPRLIFL